MKNLLLISILTLAGSCSKEVMQPTIAGSLQESASTLAVIEFDLTVTASRYVIQSGKKAFVMQGTFTKTGGNATWKDMRLTIEQGILSAVYLKDIKLFLNGKLIAHADSGYALNGLDVVDLKGMQVDLAASNCFSISATCYGPANQTFIPAIHIGDLNIEGATIWNFDNGFAVGGRLLTIR